MAACGDGENERGVGVGEGVCELDGRRRHAGEKHVAEGASGSPDGIRQGGNSGGDAGPGQGPATPDCQQNWNYIYTGHIELGMWLEL